nr:endospore germination permease [Bacillus ectoiniformans]
MIAMTAIGLKNHVFAISPLVQTAGRDAWMAVLFTMIVTVIWVPLLIYINKNSKRRSLFVWLTESVGSKASKFLALMLIIYLLLMSSVTLRETITWTNIVFLPQTPIFLLTFLFLFTCWHLAVTNLRTLSIVNIFLLFFIVVFGFLVAFANIPHKNYSLLLPILEHGYDPVFRSMIFQASGMIELFIFVLLQHKVNAPLNFRHFLAIIVVLTGLTLGPLVGAIIEFGPIEASRQRYPPYEEWGLVRFGNFIEHLDFLSIYQWLAGGFIRISLLLLLIKEALPVKTESRKKRVLFLF